MGWTPQELAEQPAPVVQRWFDFIAAEAEARKKADERGTKRGRGG